VLNVLYAQLMRDLFAIAKFLFNHALIAVLTHILSVTSFVLFAFHLQVDVIGPLLMNAGLLLAQTTDYSD